MCGIAGSLGRPADADPLIAAGRRMVAALEHRGPDDAGLWVDPRQGVCLGARRLAIVDLSPAGHQPMVSTCGRWVVALNGEIYNHLLLRDALARDGVRTAWRGNCDTETLTACIAAWGLERTLQAAVGMFALAAWDRADEVLALARDRIGEKPLHYAFVDGLWLFGSELKALTAHPAFDATIDRDALADFMALGYVPAPRTIYACARKVMPGEIVTLRVGTRDTATSRFWSLAGIDGPQASLDDVEAIDRLEQLLGEAVAQQMVADRPVGALLSGGIDSSSIVAMMTAHGGSRIDTFSIGFRHTRFDEAIFAKRVANHFGTHHTELYVDAEDVRTCIPLLSTVYDEPFADASQIPTYLVSRLAARSVTVVLSGDGGDELFGGYPRYAMGARMWPSLARVPAAVRSPLGRLIGTLPSAVDGALRRVSPHDETSGRRGLRPAQKLDKLGRVLRSPDLDAFYWRMLAPWDGTRLLRGTATRLRETGSFEAPTIEEEFMRRDLAGYLPDDILAKVDRASMAASLESRAPFLDHRVVSFALGQPHRMKFRDGTSKWLLREMLYRHVPRALVDRPKMGFEMPIASWLRGPLNAWAGELVAAAGAEAHDLVDVRALSRLLARHTSGAADGHQPLWAGLMLLGWLATARGAERAVPTAACEVRLSQPWGLRGAAA